MPDLAGALIAFCLLGLLQLLEVLLQPKRHRRFLRLLEMATGEAGRADVDERVADFLRSIVRK